MEQFSDRPHHPDRVPYFEEVLKEKEKDGLEGKKVGFLKERVERLESERKERNGAMFMVLDCLTSTKYSLSRVIEGLEGEKNEASVKDCKGECSGEESRMLLEESRLISRLAVEVEKRVDRYKEMRRKEKKELESSLISLTEENRDVNNLLRVALLEKEALEKRIKGHDHKRMPLLQFGWFMMGGGNTEQSTEISGAKSDSSECEEEVVSVLFSKASTVERMMKNLRLEITRLRRSLEESRSDTERLQCLTEKQAKEIAENKLYIKELEDRERTLAQNVEEFLMEMKAAEEEVARWKEACELEVEAAKVEIEERDKMVAVLKQELHKTKTNLDISNGKLRLKEELAMTAITAQEAAERSLKLADARAVELRGRVEELTRQLEETDKCENNIHKVRRICWPWQFFKLANTGVGNAKRMLPEMQALI
ncbi:hypothetical protein LR48_Vigan02g210100 [Vigna angularis]|uniref:Uncharacterized protein n=1 Tax=Phaseolus angularis TaxID=3914 RepID=A0A0L9TZN6_PHAAN|nr:uncharacterized protein At3g49055 isoform X1 [Vigna angularis]KOM35951.1 hypothetical protein LR48_Vigan02g210100 [Vigna angularis]